MEILNQLTPTLLPLCPKNTLSDNLDSDMIIKLKYTEDEYHLVREQLSKIAATPEQAVWKLLGNE